MLVQFDPASFDLPSSVNSKNFRLQEGKVVVAERSVNNSLMKSDDESRNSIGSSISVFVA